MKIRRSHPYVALLALAACGSPSAPTSEVATVDITAAAIEVDVGLTVQFTAEARDAGGQAIAGLTVTWSSSQEGVATIDTNGLATGVATGTSSITATIAGISASEVLTVRASQCNNRVDVILAQGEFQAYDGNQCLLLPTGQAGDRYRVAVTRPTLIEDSTDVPTVSLRINPVAVAAQGPIAVPARSSAAAAAPQRIPMSAKIDGTRIVRDLETRARTRALHEELRRRDLDFGFDFGQALRTRETPPGAARSNHPDPPASRNLYLNLDCSITTQRRVVLIDFDDDIAIYQDSIQWSSNPLSTAATGQMLTYYANYAKSMIADYFGPLSDVDGNERVIVTTTPSIPEGAAAAVYSGDFFTTTQCGSSNEAEVIYFGEDIIHDLTETDPSYLALSVLAHEMKHVVSIYNGIQRGGFHRTWIEEGTAEIAQTMSSRIAWAATGGPAVGARIDGSDIVDAVQANGGEITPEMWAVVGEVADLIVNLSTQPNSLITNPQGSANGHTFYAASWHFHRYIGDVYGGAATPFADASLFETITDQTGGSGEVALAEATGHSFAELFEEVVVATSIHEQVASAAGDFATWDLLSSTDIFVSPPSVSPPGVYPWPVTGDDNSPNAPFATATFSGPMGPGGVRYHDFVSSGQGVGAQILVTGAASGRLVVTRLQ